MNALRSELHKLAQLPSTWAALVTGLLVAPVVTAITAPGAGRAVRAGTEGAVTVVDTGFSELAFGVVGAIMLGVVAVSSEYTADAEESGGSRQILTTLTATPSRPRLLLAKAGAVTLTVAGLALVTSVVTVSLARGLLGDTAGPLTGETVGRVAGVVAYWVLTALGAFALTLLTRSGVLPLTVLVLNTSVVTVTYLLTRVIDLANFLPDMAGMRMFLRHLDSPVRIDPLTGGAVMAGEILALLVCGAIVFCRRDA